jgi:hypothetical protein
VILYNHWFGTFTPRKDKMRKKIEKTRMNSYIKEKQKKFSAFFTLGIGTSQTGLLDALNLIV